MHILTQYFTVLQLQHFFNLSNYNTNSEFFAIITHKTFSNLKKLKRLKETAKLKKKRRLSPFAGDEFIQGNTFLSLMLSFILFFNSLIAKNFMCYNCKNFKNCVIIAKIKKMCYNWSYQTSFNFQIDQDRWMPKI